MASLEVLRTLMNTNNIINNNKKYIIDTNLLLLFIVGSIDNGIYIKKSKRLNDFTQEDFQIVAAIMASAKEVAITPYIAAEVSNLIDLSGEVQIRIMEFARHLFSQCTQIPSLIDEDTQGDNFLRFGITDNSLITLVNEYIVFTHDERLSIELFSKNSNNVLLLNMTR